MTHQSRSRSHTLDRVLRSDASKLTRIVTRLQSDATRATTCEAINELLNWLVDAVDGHVRPHTWPIGFEIMRGSRVIPPADKITFVASSNSKRIRVQPWARTRAFERTTGRTPVRGVHHHALVLLHEVGHVMHHSDARQVYFHTLWSELKRASTVPSPAQFANVSEQFADAMAKQIAETAVELGYRDARY